MAASIRQTPVGFAGNGYSVFSKAFTAAVAAGSVLACYTWQYNDAATCNSVTDTLGGTWVKAQSEIFRTSANNGTITGWYKLNTSGGACTVSATWSGSGRGGIHICEIDGLTGGGALDQVIGNAATSAVSITAGTFATFAQAIEALFAFQMNDANGGVVGSGWTLGVNTDAYSYERSMTRITSSTAGVAANWTISAGSSSYVASAMAFKDAGGADTTPPSLSDAIGTQTGSTTATIGATTANDANGTMYGIVSTSATPPDVAQIQAGQMHTGAAAAWNGSQMVIAVGAKTFNTTGLTPSTSYYGHMQHKDSAGNDSTVITSAMFTTSATGSASVRGAEIHSFNPFGRNTFGVRR